MKIGYFIKEKRSKWKRHTSSTQRKTLKTQVARNQIGKQQISTPQISTNTQRFQLQELSNNRTTNVHRSQRNLEPLNFTSQATDRSNHSLSLGTVVQK
jgi:hypothetical protein